jgi:arylsulfatase A
MKYGILSRIGFVWLLLLLASGGVSNAAESAKPNVVIFFLDDSGYADFRPFGNPAYPTPNFERLAAAGTRYTQFYVPQAVCSASRASLMTGCYPGRTKVFGAIRPGERGLELNFKTMAEVLKPAGYATAVFGKWHIGDQPDTQPQARGFDESCGLMYSNDMWAGHPENPKAWSEKPLQYYENGKVTIESVTAEDQKHLTKWYTEHAVSFIERRKDAPFFLYVPHNLPHVPLFCSPEFEGKSGAGLYGDVAMELDWSLGQILDALDRAGVGENTLVLFTSDNGPWTVYGNHSGTTPFREAKGTTFDGGVRSACIARWPGRLKAGEVNERVWCSIDILPTVVGLTGAPLPDYAIDGKDLWPLISGVEGAVNPHEYYGFSMAEEFQAVMTADGRWKLHLPHKYRTVETPGAEGKPGKFINPVEPLALYDLSSDPGETKNVIADHPEVAMRMEAWGRAHADEFYPQRRRR